MRPGVDGSYDLRFGEPSLVRGEDSYPLSKKRCLHCGVQRFLGDFPLNGPSGRASKCIPCTYGWHPDWNVEEVLRLMRSGVLYRVRK